MQYLGLDKRYGQKDSEVNQFFEENILDRFYNQRKSATVLLLTFYPIFRTGEWNNLATAYELYIDVDPKFLTSFGLTVLHHHLGPKHI